MHFLKCFYFLIAFSIPLVILERQFLTYFYGTSHYNFKLSYQWFGVLSVDTSEL